MTEAVLQTQLLAFLKKIKPELNIVCELKIVKQPKQMNFRYTQLREHQRKPLIDMQGNCFAYKISDSLGFGGKGRFTAKKPLDFIYLYKPNVYIGIGFWEIRSKKIVYLVTPERLKFASDNNKHLSEAVIKENCSWIADLKRKVLINYSKTV